MVSGVGRIEIDTLTLREEHWPLGKNRDRSLILKGGHDHLPPKFEHIFVAVITFSPFFCADTLITSLLLIVCKIM